MTLTNCVHIGFTTFIMSTRAWQIEINLYTNLLVCLFLFNSNLQPVSRVIVVVSVGWNYTPFMGILFVATGCVA